MLVAIRTIENQPGRTSRKLPDATSGLSGVLTSRSPVKETALRSARHRTYDSSDYLRGGLDASCTWRYIKPKSRPRNRETHFNADPNRQATLLVITIQS